MEDNPFKNGEILIENDNNNYEDNAGNELMNFFEESKELLNLQIDINKNFNELNPIFELLIQNLKKMEEIYKGDDRFKGKDSKVKEIAKNIGEIKKNIEINQNDFKKINKPS